MILTMMIVTLIITIMIHIKQLMMITTIAITAMILVVCFEVDVAIRGAAAVTHAIVAAFSPNIRTRSSGRESLEGTKG